jgi:hypothetical protein
MVIVAGLVVPVIAPDQLEKDQQEEFGVAVRSTAVPLRYEVPEAGVTVPLPTTEVVSVYSS